MPDEMVNVGPTEHNGRRHYVQAWQGHLYVDSRPIEDLRDEGLRAKAEALAGMQEDTIP